MTRLSMDGFERFACCPTIGNTDRRRLNRPLGFIPEMTYPGRDEHRAVTGNGVLPCRFECNRDFSTATGLTASE
jgi:hypothetical protein